MNNIIINTKELTNDLKAIFKGETIDNKDMTYIKIINTLVEGLKENLRYNIEDERVNNNADFTNLDFKIDKRIIHDYLVDIYLMMFNPIFKVAEVEIVDFILELPEIASVGFDAENMIIGVRE